MKHRIWKRIIACLIFCILVGNLVYFTGRVLIPKKYNRYYVLEEMLKQQDKEYDVQVFGACHSYTSFQAKYFEDTYGISSFVMGNPGEIIPTTYLHMVERFKTDTPQVALVEIWGINAYETYETQEEIFEYYFAPNLELIPFTKEKAEVIRDFDALDMVTENFPITKYKDRLMNLELISCDIKYSFDAYLAATSSYGQEEMQMRADNNGFCEMPLWHEDSAYDPYLDIHDYDEKQPDVSATDMLTLEADMLKYVDKIIALCEEKDVELIFYRAPYVSTENELRKANWFAQYCKQKNIPFLNLEQEIAFDLETDFLDYYHLNRYGAVKATDYLAQHILDVIK